MDKTELVRAALKELGPIRLRKVETLKFYPELRRCFSPKWAVVGQGKEPFSGGKWAMATAWYEFTGKELEGTPQAVADLISARRRVAAEQLPCALNALATIPTVGTFDPISSRAVMLAGCFFRESVLCMPGTVRVAIDCTVAFEPLEEPHGQLA